MEEIRILKSERETSENLRFTLKSENDLLNGKVLEQEEIISKMQERISLDEGVLENLRGVVERDAAKVTHLQTEVRQLKADVEKKKTRFLILRKRLRRTARCGSPLRKTS